MYIKGIFFFIVFILVSTWEWTNMLALCKCMFINIATITMTDFVQNILQKKPNSAAFSKNMLKAQHGKLKPNKQRGLT